MSPKQKKLATKAPPPNKLDEKDFKVLREEKAKGRGMGLQDEKVQPGKVMKANKGKSAMVPLKKGYSKTLGVFPTINKVKPSVGGGGSGMGKGTDKVSTKKAEDFMKRRKQLGGGKLKALTRVMGSRAALLGLVGAGAVAGLNKAGKKLKEFADKKKDKKMGGGMMQKPMGYKSGMGPAGAAGPSAGRPGGRRPMQKGPKGGIGSLPKKRNSDDLVVIFSTKDGTKQIKRSDLDNMSAPEKKMGGGMIGPSQTPGYSKGTMVKARGCKLGRTRPTKIT